MVALPSPVLRALTGLAEGSGRTLVIAGPPISGKSRLLEDVRAQLAAGGSEVRDLRGVYRDRDRPFALVAPLEDSPESGASQLTVGGAETDELPIPASPLAYVPDERASGGRRGRGGERRKGTILGQTYVTRPRAAAAIDAPTFWIQLCAKLRAKAGSSMAILVEDASFADPDSREFLVYLSERARLRPLLIVLVLDAGVPAFASWEERLLGRGDVDWVRIPHAKPDPREAHRLKEAFDKLPAAARRVVAFTAMMGGSLNEVNLSRITRMSWPKLADALFPATEAGIVKIDGRRVLIPHEEWVGLVPDLLPEGLRSEMHREIAEALAALNPEPSLQRRMELAEHFYAWYRGPNALRYLLETAELTERLHAYDTADEALSKALTCLPSLPTGDRPEAEAELRLFHARVLVAAGRLPDAERELREGVTAALNGPIPPERLEELVEALLPALRAAGPRPSLLAEIFELADRCHDAASVAPAVLFQTVIAEYEFEQGRYDRARGEAARAARVSRGLGPGPVQAMALYVVGLTRLEGTPAERELAERFLKAAEQMLAGARRHGLEHQVDEVAIRLMEVKGDRKGALRAREREVPILQRLGALTTELYQQLGIAELLLEGNPDARLDAVLKRAREIAELQHLLPPSPGLTRLWLLDGRHHALTKDSQGARDRWRALADLPQGAVPPRTRAEGLLRLAILDASEGQEDQARLSLDRLGTPELAQSMRPEWNEWADSVRKRVGSAAP